MYYINFYYNTNIHILLQSMKKKNRLRNIGTYELMMCLAVSHDINVKI